MYTEFFNLQEKPFSIVPNPEYLYPSSRHRMALTYLEYALSESIGFILLTGEIGIGKTTLIRHLLSSLDPEVETAVLAQTNLSPEDLIKQVMREFDLQPEAEDKSANLEKFNTSLLDRYAQGRRTLLIIDEAQNLSLSALEEVRMLSNLQTYTDNLLQIMLVGQPELRSRIKDPRLAQLAQRIAISYHLSPLDAKETREYILYRLQKAGWEGDALFTPQAVDLIYDKSKGVPRSINILCDMALVYAFGDELQEVDEDLVRQVITDREEQGVVPNGAVWVDPEEEGQSSEFPPSDFSPQLERLNARIAELGSEVGRLDREIQYRFNEDKDRLIGSLQDLLAQERAKSDKYLTKYTFYFQKYRELEKSRSPDQTQEKAGSDNPEAGWMEQQNTPEKDTRDRSSEKNENQSNKSGQSPGRAEAEPDDRAQDRESSGGAQAASAEGHSQGQPPPRPGFFRRLFSGG